MKTKPKYRSVQARELDRLGDEERAERHDNCERLFRAFLCCQHKHTKRYEKWRCMQRYCPKCHARWSQSLVRRYSQPLRKIVEDGPGSAFFLSASIPCPNLTPAVLKAFVDRFGSVQKKVLGSAPWGSQQGLPHYANGILKLEAVVYAESSPGTIDFECQWPQAKIVFTPFFDKSDFTGILCHVLCSLPFRPQDRAKLEAASHSMHLGRRLGVFYQTPSTPATAHTPAPKEDNSSSPYTKKPPEGFRLRQAHPCPLCGDTWELVSRWLPSGELERLVNSTSSP